MGTVCNDGYGQGGVLSNRNHAAHRAACAQKQNGFTSIAIFLTCVMSLAKPIPSVLSPRILPSSNHTSVLTAPAAKARSGMFVRQCKSFLLERNGYIRTLPTLGAKRRNGLGKTADFGTNAPIFDGRAFLKCELLMDLRRFTVCNRVAETA